ncbi:uncharacterized protein DSM5745_04392 [Aspergillus mulundensis]|uniref:Uncharacterized protein n=1 Tax=Aspergillus mulundensis TaxID=1810919 RepID=A0A3D8SCL8_9EURO|nr:hypothetical protein DSM5745_04392 [Aspergillus mulundensis]RDW84066.1 hypothetical protein DSM5745_04392 [Aspergillus mulundensis]
MHFTPVLLATLASMASALPAPIVETVTDAAGVAVAVPDVDALDLPVNVNVRHLAGPELDAEVVDVDAEVEDVAVVVPVGINVRALPDVPVPLPNVDVPVAPIPQVKVPSIPVPAVPSTKDLGVDGLVPELPGGLNVRSVAIPDVPVPDLPTAGTSANVNVNVRSRATDANANADADADADADALIGLPANLRAGVTDEVEMPEVELGVHGRALPVDLPSTAGLVPGGLPELPAVSEISDVPEVQVSNVPEVPGLPEVQVPKVAELPVDVPAVPAVGNVV